MNRHPLPEAHDLVAFKRARRAAARLLVKRTVEDHVAIIEAVATAAVAAVSVMAILLAATGWVMPRLRVPTFTQNTPSTMPMAKPSLVATPVVLPALAVGAGSWATADVVVVAGRERCAGSQAREVLEPPDSA